jgi:CubicO group peptidase (beta-lactamase class C family)
VKNGYLVHEKYFQGDADTLRQTWSQTNSIISVLIGVLISRGKLRNVDQNILALLPELQSKKTSKNSKKLTLKHLLTMTSGFPDDGGEGMLGLQNIIELLTKNQEKQPGEAFLYNGTNANLLSLLISRTTGQSAESFAGSTIFKTLGIKNYVWQTKMDITNGAYGLSLKSRDIAQIGYLYLNNGSWAGEKLVDESWVKESTSPQVKTGETSECIKDYGYFWWAGHIDKNPAYFAVGIGWQITTVIPNLDMIIVVTSASHSAKQMDQYLNITKDYVLPALK